MPPVITPVTFNCPGKYPLGSRRHVTYNIKPINLLSKGKQQQWSRSLLIYASRRLGATLLALGTVRLLLVIDLDLRHQHQRKEERQRRQPGADQEHDPETPLVRRKDRGRDVALVGTDARGVVEDIVDLTRGEAQRGRGDGAAEAGVAISEVSFEVHDEEV